MSAIVHSPSRSTGKVGDILVVHLRSINFDLCPDFINGKCVGTGLVSHKLQPVLVGIQSKMEAGCAGIRSLIQPHLDGRCISICFSRLQTHTLQ